jgi:hypothetical protein
MFLMSRPAGTATIALAAALGLQALPAAQATGDLDPLLRKMGEYVASYGEKASVIVAVEKYTQSITTSELQLKPRKLTAEFAIVKAAGGWLGFRDVVEVDGQEVTDRRDRLMRLFAESTGDAAEFTRIANESARFNIGPVATNINVPTAALFFLHSSNLHRFTFSKGGEKKVDGVRTIEFAFKETVKPTLIMTRAGRDVPIEGSVWVAPDDGTVVRTRIRLRGFSDVTTTNVQAAPSRRPAVDPSKPTGGKEALAATEFVDPIDQRDIKSVADIDVTYGRDEKLGLWLPVKMAEQYEGPIKLGTRPPFTGVSTTRATYSEFKQFGTGAQVKIPK